MASPSLRKALRRAERVGRDWEGLTNVAVWYQHMLAKGRMTEARALEEVISAIPNDAHGQLIKASLQEPKHPAMELHDVIQAAESMAEAMRMIAPWETDE